MRAIELCRVMLRSQNRGIGCSSGGRRILQGAPAKPVLHANYNSNVAPCSELVSDDQSAKQQLSSVLHTNCITGSFLFFSFAHIPSSKASSHCCDDFVGKGNWLKRALRD